jgi:hypothetical protein
VIVMAPAAKILVLVFVGFIYAQLQLSGVID